MQPDCVFCRIVAGQLPSTRIYEDDDVLAFMDIGPVVKGHALVIPKEHHDPLTEVPTLLLQKVVIVVQRVTRAMVQALGAEGVNVTQANGRLAGQVVPHVHFHVIPRFRNDGFRINWNAGSYSDPAEMAELGQRIRKAVGS